MLLILLLIVWPAAEIFVAITVAGQIGWLLTILLLLAGWPAGTWALRSQGRAAWERFRADVAARRPPARAVLDGALVFVGGSLLIIPGFISDALGIILLLPPTRSLIRWGVGWRLQKTLIYRAGNIGRRAAGSKRSSPDYDVDSTATDIDQPQLRR